MRSVKSCSAVSGEWARERRSWAMWGFEVDMLSSIRIGEPEKIQKESCGSIEMV